MHKQFLKLVHTIFIFAWIYHQQVFFYPKKRNRIGPPNKKLYFCVVSLTCIQKTTKNKNMKTLNRRTIASVVWDIPNFVRIRAHDVIYSYRRFNSNSQQRLVSNLLTNNNQQKLFSIRKLLISSKTAVAAAAGPIQFNNKNHSLLISNQSPNYFLKFFSTNRVVFSKFIFSYRTAAADVYSLCGRVVNRNFDKTNRIVALNKSSVVCCPSKQLHSVTLNMGWPSEYDQSEQSKVF